MTPSECATFRRRTDDYPSGLWLIVQKPFWNTETIVTVFGNPFCACSEAVKVEKRGSVPVFFLKI